MPAEQAPSFVKRLPAVGAAYRFAARRHAGQRRESDEAAFIVHPLEVGALLDAAGCPEHVIVAGVLHDVLEKTSATPDEIRREFGSRVAGLVVALTEDPAIEPFEARKAALRSQISAEGPAAGAVSAADHVAKIRELRSRIAQARSRAEPDPADGERKLGHYLASLEDLETQIPDHALVRQLRFELEALDALPPGDQQVDGLDPGSLQA
ncbi:MAG TPA: HD domain-containing protein [Solirubrobacteraceae bacterium]|jgi:(p)ppGpp synthase/HD superfamily hydrolase|nr:HD domain-containing protein [Solirubrobacteraceae bacterium]